MLSKYKTITICGGEGSGKSTYCNMLEKYMKKNDIDYLLTREPGGTKIGEDIRQVLLNKSNSNMCTETELLLFMASRSQHLKEKIIPAIKSNKLVIIDRFYLSSLVYQGYVRGFGVDNVWELHKLSTNNFVVDLNIIIDIPPEVGLKRIKVNNRETNRLDEEEFEFHKKVRNGYLSLAKDDRFGKTIVINGNKSIDNVFDDILNAIF